MSAEQLLGSVPARDVIVVADLEAGIGTLTRLAPSSVDVTVVVVEPTPRSIDVAARAVRSAAEQSQGRVIVLANKTVGEEDGHRIAAALSGYRIDDMLAVPLDASIEAADREGASPLDESPGAPAVLALGELADLVIAPESA